MPDFVKVRFPRVAAPPPIQRMRSTSYVGASHSRLTEDWIFASIKSADAEVKGDLIALRKRSREVVRNTFIGARFQALLADNIIGPDGMRLQSKPLTPSGDYDAEAARAVEEAWKRWSQTPRFCSADRRHSWNDHAELEVQTQAQDGEGIIRLLPGFNNPFGLSVQQLDPDQLDECYSRPAGDGVNEIRMGVELDRWGGPVAYWLWDTHPTDYQGRDRKRVRVPAEQIIHRFVAKRPGQTRGVPWYAPILMDARMLAALQEAELIASRMSAAKAVVFEQAPESVLSPNTPSGATESFSWEMQPGVGDLLPPGLTAKFLDPTHPNAAFEAFSKIILHTIGAGLGTSYQSLTGDLEGVSFSSIRQGTLQERDVYRRLQAREAMHAHVPVFETWLRWALVMGQITDTRGVPYPVREFNRLLRHEWEPRGWDWVDPTADAEASALKIRLGLDTRTRICAEQGRDFEDVLDTLAKEEKMAKDRQLTLSTDTSKASQAQQPSGNGSGPNRVAGLLLPTNGNGKGHHADS